ncbi:MAG: hypothetical protein LBG48_05755 [Rickettsiales bacterium]|nr:hypothetical protein [Rickettsiales bacterium]
MSSLHIQKSGDKYFYIKESLSYRDELGRPRNKKITVGKYDPDSELPTFYVPYLVEKRNKGENIIFNGVTYVPSKLLENCLKTKSNLLTTDKSKTEDDAISEDKIGNSDQLSLYSLDLEISKVLEN